MSVDIKTPLNEETIQQLRAGDEVMLSGIIFTARDAAHQRIVHAIFNREKLPFELKNQIIYYSGPSPARPGQIIGPAGPTTSGRMDIYTPTLLAAGLKGMIGKGKRSQEVRDAIINHRAVYLVAIGGAAALISKSIKKADIIAYHDLGTEAIYRLEVESMPLIVANDIYGNDIYEIGRRQYYRCSDLNLA